MNKELIYETKDYYIDFNIMIQYMKGDESLAYLGIYMLIDGVEYVYSVLESNKIKEKMIELNRSGNYVIRINDVCGYEKLRVYFIHNGGEKRGEVRVNIYSLLKNNYYS